jgi:hypothetical protein
MLYMNDLDFLLKFQNLHLKRNVYFIQDMYDRGLYPYTKRYLSHFRNHFSTIGVNGMNEMILNFTSMKKIISTTETGIEFLRENIRIYSRKNENYQEETGNLYNLRSYSC